MTSLLILGIGLLIALVGYLLHKARVGRMEKALGRNVRDDEALSINTWMEVQDIEAAKVTGSTNAPPGIHAEAARATQPTASLGSVETDGSALAAGAFVAAAVVDTVTDTDALSDVADIAGGIFDLF